MCSTDTKFWSRRRDSFNACSRMRCPLSPNLSLYEPKSTISLMLVTLVLISNQVRRFTQLSNNSALSKLLHLDVVRISAVAFQCNNIPGERAPANSLPFIHKEAHHFCAVLRLIIVIVATRSEE